MELEFDKEIDALLRKARQDSPAVVGTPRAAHLDADELAAFAENALPDRTRAFYIAHLADCDACRKTLSGFISTNPEAASDAASVSAQPVIATKLPWYKRLAVMPNLAYTMGALVVMFSGIIGLLVYQNQMASRPTQLSRVTSSEPAREHEQNEEEPQNFSNTESSNSTANTATGSPIESVTKSGVEVGSATAPMSNSSVSTTSAAAPPSTTADQAKPVDNPAGVPMNEPNAPAKQPALAAPQLVAKEKDADDRRELEDKKSVAKTEENRVITRNDELNKMDAQAQNNISRDMSPGSNSAKMRAAGPRQVQSQTQSAQVTMDGVDTSNAGRAVSNLKNAGGKKFEFRDGIWYDTAYTGQSKKDVKRGTDKYIRLDAGLRNIADQIGGTVVVVWNGQAYKIK